jgi:hypothetical protein
VPQAPAVTILLHSNHNIKTYKNKRIKDNYPRGPKELEEKNTTILVNIDI